nr:MAG TPA: hypothetical protein [Caudoviricetes sp.]
MAISIICFSLNKFIYIHYILPVYGELSHPYPCIWHQE